MVSIETNNLPNIFPKDTWHKCSEISLELFLSSMSDFSDGFVLNLLRCEYPKFDWTVEDFKQEKWSKHDEFRKVPYYRHKVNEFAPLEAVSDDDVQAILDLYRFNRTYEGLRDFWLAFVLIHPFNNQSLNLATELVFSKSEHLPDIKPYHLTSQWYALLRRCSYHAVGTGSTTMFDTLMRGDTVEARGLWISYLPQFLDRLTDLDAVRFEIIYLNLCIYHFWNYPVGQFIVEGCSCGVCTKLTDWRSKGAYFET